PPYWSELVEKTVLPAVRNRATLRLRCGGVNGPRWNQCCDHAKIGRNGRSAAPDGARRARPAVGARTADPRALRAVGALARGTSADRANARGRARRQPIVRPQRARAPGGGRPRLA